MMTDRFDIYFSGQFMPDQEEALVRQRVGALFKASEQQLAMLFSGRTILVKRGVDIDTASQYRVAFRHAGALIDIRPHTPDSRAADASTQQRRAPEPSLTLNPPNTGSLIDCAPAVAQTVIPSTAHLGLAPPGAAMDETPPPAPQFFDTSTFSVCPEPNWSLDDCAQQPLTPAHPAPSDDGGLTLEQVEKDT